jgi:hypothetical protein
VLAVLNTSEIRVSSRVFRPQLATMGGLQTAAAQGVALRVLGNSLSHATLLRRVFRQRGLAGGFPRSEPAAGGDAFRSFPKGAPPAFI